MATTDRLILRLKEVAPKATFIKDGGKLEAYAVDGKQPRFAVFPKTVDEVSKILSFANREGLSVVPMGSGTKRGMGGIPKKLDMVLLTTRLNRITDCDTDNLTFTAESGITLSDVQKHLAKEGRGYFLPLDPPFTEKATLGGIVAANSSGPKRFLYGTARDLVIGMKAVFPNGDIVVSGGKTVKNVSGYDLCKLLIGSLGTLGVICEITFKILPLPERSTSLLIFFKDLNEADGFAQAIVRSQLLPASVETLNTLAVKKTRYDLPLTSDIHYVVAVGLEGVAESTERQMVEMKNMGKSHGALDFIALDSERHHAFWRALRDLPKGLARRYPNHVALKSNFLISKCGQMIAGYEKIAQGVGLEGAFVSHSGNGILYSYLLENRDGGWKAESFIKFIKKVASETAKHEGNLVIESAPPLIKKEVDPWGKPRGDRLLMRRIKKEIDPKGILSPGRFVGGI